MGLNENPRVRGYISKVCSQIKNSKVHNEIRLEMLSHIEEITSEYLAQGANLDDAIEKAIAHMGDAELVGRQLNKIHRIGPEWSIVILASIFTVLGLTAMYFIQTKGALLSNLDVFNRSIVFSLLGIIVALGLYFIDYNKIKHFSSYIYVATLLGLTYTIICGIQVNGVSAFMKIGPMTINYVDFSPFLFTISLAGLFSHWNWNEPKKVVWGLIVGLIPIVLMLSAPSLSAVMIYLITLLVLMIVSGVKRLYICATMVSGICLLLAYIVTAPYRIIRFLNFINPWEDPRGQGYIYLQLKKLTQSAGLFGQGFSFDPRTLPEVHTDFVFTYIIYTFGWIAGIVLTALVMIFLIRITRIAKVVKNDYGKLLVSGFVTILAVQFVWNILMNLSLAPISAVSLPFISFGGSQFLANMVAMGIISNVYKQKSWVETKA